MAESKEDESKPVEAAQATLSQLGARILNQLSISSWLPSAALVLLAALIAHIGDELAESKYGHKLLTLKPLAAAFQDLGRTNAGSLVLLAVAVIVLTMLTQAFAFEAIRFFEGYWGTSRFMVVIARRRAARWRRLITELKSRHRALTKKAWKQARRRIEKDQRKLERSGEVREFTDEEIDYLEEAILSGGAPLALRGDERAEILSIDWRQHAKPELVRQLIDVRNRIDDFPVRKRALPTRLGNVLRHYEDQTGRTSLVGFVDSIFDSLPFSMRVSYDEQRGRLDLYCSLVLILELAGFAAFMSFVWNNWVYAVVSWMLLSLVAFFSYRAAIASARYYGVLLVTVSRYATRLNSASAQR